MLSDPGPHYMGIREDGAHELYPAAQRPRDEPPGQRLEPILDPSCRSWPGRLHRVVRRRALVVGLLVGPP